MTIQPQLKIDLAAHLAGGAPLRLDLGCGATKKAGYLGVDGRDLDGVDIVADLEQGLPFVPDDSVDAIYSSHFFEHIADLPRLLRECLRVLKKDGQMEIVVPHFSNPYFYSDYTHSRFFGLYTFYYFVPLEQQLARTVPNYAPDIKFRVLSQHLGFYSPFPGRRRRWRAKWEAWVNRNSWRQEFYEENLCYLLPCYEIKTVLAPEK